MLLDVGAVDRCPVVGVGAGHAGQIGGDVGLVKLGGEGDLDFGFVVDLFLGLDGEEIFGDFALVEVVGFDGIHTDTLEGMGKQTKHRE